MRTFVERNGEFEEIYDFSVHEIGNKKLEKTLLETLKLSVSTDNEFEYVALIDPPLGFIEIRYLQNRGGCDLFHQSEKQEIGRNIGIFITTFQGDAILPTDVQKYIKRRILEAWTHLAKAAATEIGHVVSAIYE